MDSNQIDVGLILDKKEKNVHPSAAKLLTSRHSDSHPDTTLSELVAAIKKRLPKKTMLPRQWEDFKNQFDESEPDSKKTFNDFLSMLQRESFYRDTLAEALIFKQSSVRLSYQKQIKFLTQQQLKMQNEMGALSQANNASSETNDQSQISFSYLIVDLIMFHFQGSLMLLTTNELGHCRLFDCDTGVLQHDFVFEQSFGSKKRAGTQDRKKNSGPRGEEEKDMTQSNMETDSVITTEPIKLDAIKSKRDTTALSGISESSSTLHCQEGQAQEPNSKRKKTRISVAQNAGSSTNIVTGSKFSKPKVVIKSNASQDGNAAIKDKNLVIINEEDVEDAITYRSKPRKKGQDQSSIGSLFTSEYQATPVVLLEKKYEKIKMTKDKTVPRPKMLPIQDSSPSVKRIQSVQMDQQIMSKTRQNTISQTKKPLINRRMTTKNQVNQFGSMADDSASMLGNEALRSARATTADSRALRIKAYDEESKARIHDHLRKQKVTQKLGLDFHIFDDPDGRPPIVPSRVQTAKAAMSKSLSSTVGRIDRQKKQRTFSNLLHSQVGDTMTVQSKQTKNNYGSNVDKTDAMPSQISPHKLKKEVLDENFCIDKREIKLVQDIDRYRARKEPIPFGMSEKIWELDKVRENFDKYAQEFQQRKRQYDAHEELLSDLRAGSSIDNGGGGYRSRDRRTTTNRLQKQDSTASFNSGHTNLTKKGGDRKGSVINRNNNRDSQDGAGSIAKGRNNKAYQVSYDSNKGGRDRSGEKLPPAYVSLGKREHLIGTMRPIERFQREMRLLHVHRHADVDILAGIRADQQIIAQHLQNDQVGIRVLAKARDRNLKWLAALQDEERKDPKDQRLPSIESMDLDRYEESYEDRNQQKHAFIEEYKEKLQDESIGQIMRRHINKKEGDSLRAQSKKRATVAVKPSRPMFMTYYKKKSLVVFALLGEVKIVMVRQNGQKKTFPTMASHKLDRDMPVGITIGSHKLTGKLLIFVACQSQTLDRLKKSKSMRDRQLVQLVNDVQDKNEKNTQGGKDSDQAVYYVTVIEIDHKNDYAVKVLKRIPSRKGQISKILYKKRYGLIMACYRGYIESYDPVNFEPMNSWANNMTAIGSEQQKAKVEIQDQKRKEQRNFDKWIAEELTKRSIVQGGSGSPEPGENQRSASGYRKGTADQSELTAMKSRASTLTKKSAKQIREEHERANREKMERNQAMLRVQTLKALKKTSKEKQQIETINCIDYSYDLYLIAFGGVHGQIGVLDSTTMNFIGMFDAHANVEVSAIYFFKKERQMISISVDGDCALWDAQKMTILQTIKNKDLMKKTKHISTSTFDQLSGSLLMATSEVFKFELNTKAETKIEIDQQMTVAGNYLQQMKSANDRKGTFASQNKQIKQEDEMNIDEESEEEVKVDKRGKKIVATKPAVTAKQQKVDDKLSDSYRIVSDILNYKMLPQMLQPKTTKAAARKSGASKFSQTTVATRSFDKGSYTVLPSSQTRLCGCFINVNNGRMFTVDIDCLIRQWDLTTGECVRSYPLEKPSKAGDQSAMDNNLSLFKQRHKIQALQLSPDFRALAVALENGHIQINNIYSGCVLYNKAAENMIDLGPHVNVSGLAFFHKQTNYWIAATLWEGKVAFLQRPMKDKGGDIIREKKVDSSHRRDVLCLDITENNHMATASDDNSIIFWNTYNAKEGKIIQIPDEMMMQSINEKVAASIQAIRFASNNDFLFVFLTSGAIYILETQSETFLEPPDFADPNKLINPFNFTNTPNFSVYDVKPKFNDSSTPGIDELYILAVQESGVKGSLYKVTFMDHEVAKKQEANYASLKRKIPNRYAHKKVFTITGAQPHLNPFNIPQCKQRMAMGLGIANPFSVIKVEILSKLNMFIISQAFGVISFYSLENCELISYMNQETWSPVLQRTMYKQVISNNKHAFIDSDDEEYTTAGETAAGQTQHDEESVEISVGGQDSRNHLGISTGSNLDDFKNHHQMPFSVQNRNGEHSSLLTSPANHNHFLGDGNQEMIFSAKFAKDSTRNTNFNSTSKTKNSTQPTSAGMVSPK